MNTNPEAAPRPRVLVVDDEPAILFTLKRILEHTGYEVQTASSGREGLIAFQQGPWDLVTLDRSMPDMNGEEVAAEMTRVAPQVPLILITGFPQAVLRPGLFNAVLGKPFRPAELLQCFSQVLARHAEGAGQLPQGGRMAGCGCD
ncbi:MAG: response regulator [Chthoniobacter sp.]|uniref:response regulator n=1 Tax=Chthoniobacter sp. TaxID=2510640 RepID=UPI0032AA7C3F